MQKLQTRNSNLKFTSYYSQHYSNSAATIQISGTIQNTGHYSNSEYEQSTIQSTIRDTMQSTWCVSGECVNA
jgi:hypothetical protein